LSISVDLQESCEFAADLFEDFSVTDGHGLAGSLEGIEGTVNRANDAAEPCFRMQQSAAQEEAPQAEQRPASGPFSLEQVCQPVTEVLASDGAAGLPGSPRGEGAPVGAFRDVRARCR